MSPRPSGIGVGISIGVAIVFAFITTYSALNYEPVYTLVFGVTLLVVSVCAVETGRDYRRHVQEWREHRHREQLLQDLWGHR